ncbi:MAG: protocatechuate 3,4-dioxygenase beta subunit [Planctomycetota bacterium]|jgi:protocatechuate 3,4-dioxygenase beta subunit
MRYLFALVALLVAAGFGWFLMADRPAPDPTSVVPVTQDEDAGSQTDATDLGSVLPTPTDQRTSVTSTGPAVSGTAGAVADEGDHPWAEDLSGVTGRVLEASGEPAAGLVVSLLEVSSDTLLNTSTVALPHDSIEVGEATTDAEGRFLIKGAMAAAMHGIGIDLGGQRATVRVVDESLDYGKVTDIGDVVMSEFGTVFGLVIDDDGEPVQGARVRLATLPEIAVQMGFLDLHSDSIIAVPEQKGFVVADFPAWGSPILDRLPVSTTHTNAEGEFRFEAVPTGRVCGGVDQAGCASTIIPGFDLAAGAEHDLDELELLEGRIAEGRVIDTRGLPVAGVKIFAGVLFPMLDSGFLQPGPTTGEDGRFSAPGVPESGTVVVAARRSNHDAWVTAQAEVVARGLVLTLPSASAAIIELVDAVTGEPLSGADIAVRPFSNADDFGFAKFMSMMHRQDVPRAGVQAGDPGQYHVAGLADGEWTVIVDVPGYGKAEELITHSDGVGPHRIEVERGMMLHYVVVDDVTGAPISRAHLSLMTTGGGIHGLASGWSDETGAASMGPLPSTQELPTNQVTGGFAMARGSGRIIIQHPEYGRSGIVYEAPKPRAAADPAPEPTEIRLAHPLVVSGKVTWAGATPGFRYMVALEQRDDELADLPRMTVTSDAGEFALRNVAPGSYHITLMERFLNGDPMKLLAEAASFGRPSYREALVVVAGVDPVVLIHLDGEGAAKKGWIEGSIRVDGQPVANAEVHVGRDHGTPTYTDGAGRFRTEDLDYGMKYLSINAAAVPDPDGGEDANGEQLYTGYIDIPSGRAIEAGRR